MKSLALFTASILASAASSACAGTIIWVSQYESETGKEFLELIRSQGHTVTEHIIPSSPLAQQEIDEMNAASLVVFSKKSTSSVYNTTDWDAITAPMIVMTPYVTRSSIWAWFGGTGLVDQTPAEVVINEQAHALFAGVTITDGKTQPWHTAIDRGTSFATDAVINGGTRLASTPSGAVVAAEWPAGTVAAGPRLLLPLGSREAANLPANPPPVSTAGKFNVTPLGEHILLNAVALYVPPVNNPDIDGDGVLNALDAFPNNPNEWEDTDSDGIGNNADPDDDNDGVLDAADVFPRDPTESTDGDGDGIGDNADPDHDNDWVPDVDDDFPLNPIEWDDDDGDGIGNNADPDANGDGIPDPPLSRIVWVSQAESEIGKQFIHLLTEEGHTVTRFVGTSQTLTDTPALVARIMHTADLVIFSRQISSDQYNTPVWDQIKTPMLVLTPYVLRTSRWGWFATDALAAGTPASMLVPDPSHPLFTGVPVDAGATAAWHVAVDQGTSFMADLNVVGGTTLATTDTGELAAVQWPAGTVAAGPRMYLAAGAWEAVNAAATAAGNYNLTDIGARIFLNAVSLYTAPVFASRLAVTTTSFDPATRKLTLTWPSQTGQNFHVERSADFVTWEALLPAIAATGTTTSFNDENLPADPTGFFYRVVREN